MITLSIIFTKRKTKEREKGENKDQQFTKLSTEALKYKIQQTGSRLNIWCSGKVLMVYAK